MIVGPKVETDHSQGVRYHAKDQAKFGGGSEWYYEERQCRLRPTTMQLVRIMVGKVTNGNRLAEILRNTPIQQDQPGWNCVSWVKKALETLGTDPKALGTSVVEWDKVRDAAMDYCQRKKDQHRFDSQGNFDASVVPTYDLMEGKEIIE